MPVAPSWERMLHQFDMDESAALDLGSYSDFVSE